MWQQYLREGFRALAVTSGALTGRSRRRLGRLAPIVGSPPFPIAFVSVAATIEAANTWSLKFRP